MPKGRTVFVQAPGAVETVERLGQPGLRPAADAIAAAIPSFVPVNVGTMQKSYHPSVAATADESKVRVYVGSPFWHWMEYGTRNNPAYRPVQSAVTSLGLRFEAH
jgi:hypothetical protein